jgi:hypothetical protein
MSSRYGTVRSASVEGIVTSSPVTVVAAGAVDVRIAVIPCPQAFRLWLITLKTHIRTKPCTNYLLPRLRHRLALSAHHLPFLNFTSFRHVAPTRRTVSTSDVLRVRTCLPACLSVFRWAIHSVWQLHRSCLGRFRACVTFLRWRLCHGEKFLSVVPVTLKNVDLFTVAVCVMIRSSIQPVSAPAVCCKSFRIEFGWSAL